MTAYNVVMRRPRIEIRVTSEHADFLMHFSPYKDADLVDSDISDMVLSFDVKNSLSDDSSAFTFIIASTVEWNKLLNPNDIISIIVHVTDDNGHITNEEIIHNKYNPNLITGMVSEVRVQGDFGDNREMFQISGKSMSKAFEQYQIGVIEEVQTTLSSMGWLWDTNADLTAMSTETNNTSTDTDVTVSGKGNAQKVWNYLTGSGWSGAAAAGAMGSMKIESGFVPNKWNGGHVGGESVPAGSDSGYGLIQWTGPRKDKIMSFLKSKNAVDKDSELKWELYYLVNKDPGKSSAFMKSYVKIKDVTDAAHQWSATVEAGGGTQTVVDQRTANAKAYYNKFKGTKGDSDSSDSDSSGSSTTTTNTTGTVDSTAEAIAREKATSQGIAFTGNTVASVESQVIKRFIKYMRYKYAGGTVTASTFDRGYHEDGNYFDLTHYLGYSDMTSWDEYEMLQDSTQYTSFNGSLMELMRAVTVPPFNELYFESGLNSTDGANLIPMARIVCRRTPFNQEDWTNLPHVRVPKASVISMDIGKSDSEAYSVFVANPSQNSVYFQGLTSGALGSAPQYHPSLVDVYGYSKLEVQSNYIGATGMTNPEKQVKKDDPDTTTTTPKKKDSTK